MVGSTWTNPDQVAFLTAQLGNFVEAQGSKTLTTFWTNINCEFFSQWPTPESEMSSVGLDPDWDGSQKTSKQKKNKSGTTSSMITIPGESWVRIRREVSAQSVY